MFRRQQVGRGIVMVLAGTMVAILTACAGNGGSLLEGSRKVDAGGLTRDEALGMSIEEQFDLVRERDARMQEILTEAQLQIDPGVWGWGQKGGAPITGANAWSLPGMKLENSYYLEMWRAVNPDGAIGAKSDLDPMIAYFESKGWTADISESSGPDYLLQADTGEGFLVSWRVQRNGQYNMEIMSQSYWGDSRALLREISDRTPPEAVAINESVPGVYIPFPKWSDPLDYAPNLQDHSK